MIQKTHRHLVSIQRACILIHVSKSWYYQWLKRSVIATPDVLAHKVKRVFLQSKKTYGTRRIKKALAQEGVMVSRKQIGRKMKEQELVAKARRKTRSTTDSSHKLAVAPNLLQQNFAVDAPNQACVTDITYLATTEGWLYLAIVLDLYSRRIVGWMIDKRITRQLVIAALQKALTARRPQPGLICHSDRGSQYCSHDYQEVLQAHEIRYSMSRKSECLDNACAETFFHSLKVELLYGEPMMSRYNTEQSVREYIEVFYNRQRLHSSIGYVAPCHMEAVYQQSTFLLSA